MVATFLLLALPRPLPPIARGGAIRCATPSPEIPGGHPNRDAVPRDYERGNREAAEKQLRQTAQKAMPKSARRAELKAAGELTQALLLLDLPPQAATAYGKRLAAAGVRAAAELHTLPAATLDACDVRRAHRQKMLAGGRLAAAELAATAVAGMDAPAAEAAAAAAPPAADDDDEADDAAVEVVEVTAELAGQRVDAALAAALAPLSRSYFGALCADGRVTSDGVAVKKSAKAEAGATLRARLRAAPELQVAPEDLPLDVLYEDEQLLVVNKAAGMVVHPAPGHWGGTFVNALLHHVPPSSAEADDALPDINGDGLRPGIVHRLDRYTSGAIVAAKRMPAQRGLLRAFADRRVWKVYAGVIVGELNGETRAAGVAADGGGLEVTAPIGRHRSDRLRMAVRTDEGFGRPARTTFRTLATDGRHSLVCALLGTGRTHQIRVHLAHMRRPLLGDPLYGDAACNKRESRRAPRPMLHAYQLRFAHPTDGGDVSVDAPPPDDFCALGGAIVGCKPAEFGAWLGRAVEDAIGDEAAAFATEETVARFERVN